MPIEAVVGGFLSLVLGLITLGVKAWWFDEAFNVSLARNEWPKFLAKTGYYEPSQALYLVLFKLWRIVTPETEWFTRLPSVVVAAVTAALVGYLAARLFSRTTGIVAGVLMATNATIVAWSQQARTYTLAALTAVVVTILFLRAMESRTDARRPWILYGVVGGIGVYAHFFVAFVLAAHATLIPRLSHEKRRRLREAWVVVAVACLPAAVVVVVGENSGADWIRTTSWNQIRDAMSELVGFNVVALVAAALGGVAIFLRRAPNSARWKGTLLLAWALAPIAGALVISIFKPMVTGRYLLVCAPALAILGAAALVAIRPRWIAAAITIALLAISTRQIVTWYDEVPEDWRGAARLAAAMERDGVTVALYPVGNYHAYQLYAPLPSSCRYVPGHHEPRCAFRASGRETVVVTTVPEWRELPGVSNYVVTKEWGFGDRIRVLRLERRVG